MSLPPHRTAPTVLTTALTMTTASQAMAVMSFALDEIGQADTASAPMRIKLLPAGAFTARDGWPYPNMSFLS